MTMQENQLLESLKHMQEMLDESTTVCLCNPETLKFIKEQIDIPSNVVFIEEKYVEVDELLVIKDKQMKKDLLRVHRERSKG